MVPSILFSIQYSVIGGLYQGILVATDVNRNKSYILLGLITMIFKTKAAVDIGTLATCGPIQNINSD